MGRLMTGGSSVADVRADESAETAVSHFNCDLRLADDYISEHASNKLHMFADSSDATVPYYTTVTCTYK